MREKGGRESKRKKKREPRSVCERKGEWTREENWEIFLAAANHFSCVVALEQTQRNVCMRKKACTRRNQRKEEQGACVEPSWALVFRILKEENKGRGSVSGDCLEITVPEVQGSTWNEALSGSLPSGYSPLTLHSLTGCIGLIGSPYPQPSWTQIPFGPLDFPPSSGWKDSLK